MFWQMDERAFELEYALLLRMLKHGLPQSFRHARLCEAAQAGVDRAEFVRVLLVVACQHRRQMRQHRFQRSCGQNPVGIAIAALQSIFRSSESLQNPL